MQVPENRDRYFRDAHRRLFPAKEHHTEDRQQPHSRLHLRGAGELTLFMRFMKFLLRRLFCFVFVRHRLVDKSEHQFRDFAEPRLACDVPSVRMIIPNIVNPARIWMGNAQ